MKKFITLFALLLVTVGGNLNLFAADPPRPSPPSKTGSRIWRLT
jgi:hypothetical protein